MRTMAATPVRLHPEEKALLTGTSDRLRVAIYWDGASLTDMLSAYRKQSIDGVTTNPTLMRRAGVSDYAEFAGKVLAAIPDLPVSFEVVADEFEEMARQAREISSWGPNVFVKIPVTNTGGESSMQLVKILSQEGIKVNVTAVLGLEQVRGVVGSVADRTPAMVSVFAGRIADTGRDPVPMMRRVVAMCAEKPNLKVLWGSPREVLNVYQADACGCHVIAVTPDLLRKLELRGKNLEEFSRETVQMFYDDALEAGLTL